MIIRIWRVFRKPFKRPEIFSDSDFTDGCTGNPGLDNE